MLENITTLLLLLGTYITEVSYVTLRYITLRYITLRYITLRDTTSPCF